jgi:hypothetical protein
MILWVSASQVARITGIILCPDKLFYLKKIILNFLNLRAEHSGSGLKYQLYSGNRGWEDCRWRPFQAKS